MKVGALAVAFDPDIDAGGKVLQRILEEVVGLRVQTLSGSNGRKRAQDGRKGAGGNGSLAALCGQGIPVGTDQVALDGGDGIIVVAGVNSGNLDVGFWVLNSLVMLSMS